MGEYSILQESADGVLTRQCLRYASDEEAVADWLPNSKGKRVEIMTGGRIVARWDKRVLAGRAA
jgi:hypothetical protein